MNSTSTGDAKSATHGASWKGSAHKAGPGFRAVKVASGSRRVLPKLKSPPLVPGLGVHQKSLELWQQSSSVPELGAPPKHLVLMLQRSQADEARQTGGSAFGQPDDTDMQSTRQLQRKQWRLSTEHADGGESDLHGSLDEDVSSISRRICRELDRTCGILLAKSEYGDMGTEDELQEHVNALQSIAKATSLVKVGLDSDLVELHAVVHDPVGYDDPLLQKARQLSSVATKICEDLSAPYQGRTQSEEYQDVTALQEIATVTMTVKDTMDRLQEESWAVGVLKSTATEEDDIEAISPIATAGEHVDLGSEVGYRSSAGGYEDNLFRRQVTIEAAGTGDALWESTMLPDAGPADKKHRASLDGSSPAESASAGGVSPGRVRRSSTRRTSFEDQRTGPLSAPAVPAPQPGASQAASSSAEAAPPPPPLGKGEVLGLPSLAERLARVTQKGSDVSEEELERIRTAFNRFRVPGTGDLHHDNLEDLLHYLGHVITAGDQFPELWTSVTNYETIDFDEFLQFMDLYINYEKEQYRLIFDAYDVDGSGEISIAELRNLTTHLGIAPRQGMMIEALNLVDEDRNGQLGFDELMQFLVVYRHTEGFTREEVKQLRRVFDRLSGQFNEGRLPMDLLCDALVRVFGPQVEDEANKLEEKLRRASGGDALAAEGFLFAEFLVFARRVREGQKASLDAEYAGTHPDAPGGQPGDGESAAKDEFAEFDEDNSGKMSRAELRQALFKLGYEPLRAVIDEVLTEVRDPKVAPDEELDLNEFFDFLLIYRQREGFLKSEVEEFLTVFQRYDEDGSEQISALELADIFRFLGHSPALDDLHLLLRQVDSNNTNELDFREFLKLMQMHRNAEIHKMRTVFAEHVGENDVLNKDGLLLALADMNHEPTKNVSSMDSVDSDAFIAVVDMCRLEMVTKQRKKAGFTSRDIDQFRDIFNGVDKDGSGVIDSIELQAILKEFGWEPRTREEQDKLVKRFDIARALAKEAGITENTPQGSANIKFWELIQLARILQKERDREEEAAVEKLIRELKFSHVEVDEFRQVFKDWTKPAQDEEEDELEMKKPLYLGRDVVRRIARTLGIQLTSKMGDQLEQQLILLEESYNKLNFKGFLRLMRWFLDSNLAGDDASAAS